MDARVEFLLLKVQGGQIAGGGGQHLHVPRFPRQPAGLDKRQHRRTVLEHRKARAAEIDEEAKGSRPVAEPDRLVVPLLVHARRFEKLPRTVQSVSLSTYGGKVGRTGARMEVLRAVSDRTGRR